VYLHVQGGNAKGRYVSIPAQRKISYFRYT